MSTKQRWNQIRVFEGITVFNSWFKWLKNINLSSIHHWMKAVWHLDINWYINRLHAWLATRSLVSAATDVWSVEERKKSALSSSSSSFFSFFFCSWWQVELNHPAESAEAAAGCVKGPLDPDPNPEVALLVQVRLEVQPTLSSTFQTFWKPPGFFVEGETECLTNKIRRSSSVSVLLPPSSSSSPPPLPSSCFYCSSSSSNQQQENILSFQMFQSTRRKHHVQTLSSVILININMDQRKAWYGLSPGHDPMTSLGVGLLLKNSLKWIKCQ